MARDLIGHSIGPYTVLEQLGAGGMATVYRACETGAPQTRVAMKILPRHLATNAKTRQRFAHEAHMATCLQHPHILPVYDFGDDDGVPYIVMKLVEGGTLAARLAAGPLDLTMAAHVLGQVAGALDYAHAQGVIHRDIKPQNILFDAENNAYLTDFGIARLAEGGETLGGQAGFIGTAAYASPEQCRGDTITPVSDIYSLGVVLYEMLTGVLPFQGATPLAIMHQHISEPVPNPLGRRPQLPLAVHEVTGKALAKLPHVRYQTATALSMALNKALARELGTVPLADKAPPPGPNPTFDKPANAYTPPPPIPGELLQDLLPAVPSTGESLAVPVFAEATPRAPQTTSSGDDVLYLVLLVLTAILAATAVATVYITR